MSEYNAFLEEWKSIRSTQETVLKRLEEQNEFMRNTTKKKTYLIVGGLLIAFLAIGIAIGCFFDINIKNSSVSLAVATQNGCLAQKGHWQVQEGVSICAFYVQ